MSVLLCLHGWGGSADSFTELREALKGSGIMVLAPDLPGFGSEPEPKEPWTTDDYAEWVQQWTRKQLAGSREQLLLLGHSHGGRIALKLTATCSLLPAHLFLCASAGIRHPRHFKRILGLTLAKTGKTLLNIPGLRAFEPLGKIFLYRLVRVHDYEQASPIMRQTLINVTKEDLRPLLPTITVPTDIFWGEEDGMTPVADAYLMHKEIAGSALHVYPGVRHRVHRDRAREIAEVIVRTLRSS